MCLQGSCPLKMEELRGRHVNRWPELQECQQGEKCRNKERGVSSVEDSPWHPLQRTVRLPLHLVFKIGKIDCPLLPSQCLFSTFVPVLQQATSSLPCLGKCGWVTTLLVFAHPRDMSVFNWLYLVQAPCLQLYGIFSLEFPAVTAVRCTDTQIYTTRFLLIPGYPRS